MIASLLWRDAGADGEASGGRHLLREMVESVRQRLGTELPDVWGGAGIAGGTHLSEIGAGILVNLVPARAGGEGVSGAVPGLISLLLESLSHSERRPAE